MIRARTVVSMSLPPLELWAGAKARHLPNLADDQLSLTEQRGSTGPDAVLASQMFLDTRSVLGRALDGCSGEHDSGLVTVLDVTPRQLLLTGIFVGPATAKGNMLAVKGVVLGL